MALCRAFCYKNPCSEPATHFPYCSRHFEQERALYEFYKYHEASFRGARNWMGNPTALAQAHQNLTCAILGRQLHMRWYFNGSVDYNHITHVEGLHGQRYTFERDIPVCMGLAVERITSDYEIIKTLGDTLADLVSRSDAGELYEKLHELPSVRVYKNDKKAEELKNAYTNIPVIW